VKDRRGDQVRSHLARWIKFLPLGMGIKLIFLIVSANAQIYSEDAVYEDVNQYPAPIELIPKSQPESRQTLNSLSSEQDTIDVSTLAKLTPDTIGLLDENSGGFPIDVWQGTSIEVVETLLSKLPDKVESSSLRSLMQRLLLSLARAPEYSDEDATAALADGSVFPESAFVYQSPGMVSLEVNSLEAQRRIVSGRLLEMRLSRLASMGDWKHVQELIDMVPSDQLTEELLEYRVDALLVEERTDEACAEASLGIQRTSRVYWQQIFIFCQLRDGNVDAAQLGMSLLSEQNEGDPAFYWVSELMIGNRPLTPNGLKRLTPLHLSMLRHARRPIPEFLVRSGDPTLLRMMSVMPAAYIEDEEASEEEIRDRTKEAEKKKLLAAERAVRLGVLQPEILREQFRSVSFANSKVATSVEDIDAGDVEGRARLLQIAESQTIPAARAEVIARAIDLAQNSRRRAGPDLAVIASVYEPMLLALSPSNEMLWFAGHATRALLALGETKVALQWLELTRTYARSSSEAAEIFALLWPIDHIVNPRPHNTWSPHRLSQWEEMRGGLSNGHRSLILNLFTALKDPIGSEDWFPLMKSETRRRLEQPAPHVWHGLTLAAETGRLGETILLVLIAMGEDAPREASPLTLQKVIASLDMVGLPNDARQIAIEAALGRGL